MTGSRRAVWMVYVLVVVVVLGGVVALVMHGISSNDQPALPAALAGEGRSSDAPSSGVAGGYALNTQGIRRFLTSYQRRFHTTRVVDLVLYRDYAVVDVPAHHAGGRPSGWLYGKNSAWTRFGGVRAVLPGSSTVDTRRLDEATLMRNVTRARASLKVESPSQAFVVIRFIPGFEQRPTVDIHLANEFKESGYLMTRLDGTVERAHPFGR